MISKKSLFWKIIGAPRAQIHIGHHVSHLVGNLVHLHVSHHVHLHVGRHVSHHVGNNDIVSAICEVSGMLTERKSESITYGRRTYEQTDQDQGRC